MIQAVIRVVVSGLLVLVIGLCLNQIYRIWFDKTIILNPFSYLKANDNSTTSGLYFTTLVSQDLLDIRNLYARPAGAPARPAQAPSKAAQEKETASVDFGSQTIVVPFEVPRFGASPFSSIDISAYGIKISEIFKSFSRIVEQPYAIDGTISESAGRVRVTATLQNPPGRGAPIQWSFEEKDAPAASFHLACEIVHMLTADKEKLIGETTSFEFCAFTRAWRSYQAFRLQRGIAPAAESNESLVNAARWIEGLTLRKSRFPHVYKLAALIFQEQQRPEDAVRAITRYRELAAEKGIPDPDAKSLEDSLKTALAAHGDSSPTQKLELRARKRPVQPGFSASSESTTAGTICCVVQDSAGVTYLLSAEHAFRGQIKEKVLQPAKYDGGTDADAVAELTQIITPKPGTTPNKFAGAIARLLPNVQPNPALPEIGRLAGVASGVTVGETLRMVGRTSGLATSKVQAIELSVNIEVGTGPARFSGLIGTSPMSQAGDSGAPVVNARNELVGMIYAGSPAQTIVIPIGPILEAFKVTLVQ
jgi:hypothetical protein